MLSKPFRKVLDDTGGAQDGGGSPEVRTEGDEFRGEQDEHKVKVKASQLKPMRSDQDRKRGLPVSCQETEKVLRYRHHFHFVSMNKLN